MNQEIKSEKMDDGLIVKKGDIFYASWGYDQTNIDFVKVVEVSPSGKSVKAVEIGQIVEKFHEFMSEDVIPAPNHIKGEPFRALIAKDMEGKPMLKGKGQYFWRDNGKSHYQSHYA